MHKTISPTLLLMLALCVGAAPAAAAPTPRSAAHEVDNLQVRLAAHIDAVRVKIAAARKAGRVSPTDGAKMNKKIASIRTDAAGYVKKQGFLSAAEYASYDRALIEIEGKLR